MLKGENGRDVGARVKTRIAEVVPTLPRGVRLTPFYDQTEVINRTSSTVRRNLIEGSLLVSVVLFVFLRDARLAVVVPLSVAIIFLLLFVTFGRLRQAGLVLLNVPFALVGGVAALWLRGLTLNLSASVGFIALFGVAVLNGVILVTAVNRLREEGRELRDAVLSGAATRVRPVMMTAMVAALGFVPMALSHGAGAEIQRSLASVVIGGVMTSTLLTLMVLPTLYDLLERRVLRRDHND
jgi:Cu/Ag efflux pump CusA